MGGAAANLGADMRRWRVSFGAGVWLVIVSASACSSTQSAGGGTETIDSIWDKPCTFDPAAEPIVAEGYQRCSEVWAQETRRRREAAAVEAAEAAAAAAAIAITAAA